MASPCWECPGPHTAPGVPATPRPKLAFPQGLFPALPWEERASGHLAGRAPDQPGQVERGGAQPGPGLTPALLEPQPSETPGGGSVSVQMEKQRLRKASLELLLWLSR